MRGKQLIYAAIIAAMMPTVAFADDPHDAAMRNAAARARDREMTRQLNLEEMARVQKRDARFTQRSRPAHTGGNDAVDEYAARSRDHERAMTIYTRNRAQYERDMAKWDRAVAACRAGDYRACDN